MTPVKFSQVGESLYGPSWRGTLAAALSVAERTVRRWATGDHPIPPGIPNDLASLCERKAKELTETARNLRK